MRADSWRSATTSWSSMRDPTSLMERLRQREYGGWAMGTSVQKSRELYQNVPLNAHVASVQPPRPCYIRGFSRCGRYLIAFARELDRMIVWEYTGMAGLLPGNLSDRGGGEGGGGPSSSRMPTGDIKFEHLFRHMYDVTPPTSGLALFHRMAMFFHGNIAVVASDKASDAEDFGDFGTMTMLSSVDLTTGKIIDSVELAASGVDLSLPNTVSTHRDGQMVLLSPWSLTLLRLDRDGFFSRQQVIGRFCYPDDEDVIAGVYDGETLTEPAMSRLDDESPQVYDALKQRLLAYMFYDGRNSSDGGGGRGGRGGGTGTSAEAGGLPAAATPQTAATTSATIAGGLASSTPSGAFQQSAFYYYFRMVVETELTHAHFLDEDRLLLNWGGNFDRSASHGRMPDGIKAIYNTKTTVFEKVFPPFDQKELNEFIRQDPMLMANTRHPTCVWEQFAMDDGLRCHHAWTQHNGDSQYLGIHRCHGRQTSPYLDQELFQYDDKSISKNGRPVAAMRLRTAKFIANAWPSHLKFALDIDNCMHMSSVGRQQQHNNNEHDMTETIERRIHLLYLFHPYDPAVFCIVQTYDEYMGEADVINVFTCA